MKKVIKNWLKSLIILSVYWRGWKKKEKIKTFSKKLLKVSSLYG